MFTVEFASKAKRQISKLDNTVKQAIKRYLDEKVSCAKDKKALYEIGGTELVGNLKGLWRFKSSEFKKYRIIAYLEDNKPSCYCPVDQLENLGTCIVKAYQGKVDELPREVKDVITRRGWNYKMGLWNEFFESLVS